MDERFQTPRASALSSRSQETSSSSSVYRTPRDALSVRSNRSNSSSRSGGSRSTYHTPRTSYKESSFHNSSHGHQRSADRSRDLRRFSQQSHRSSYNDSIAPNLPIHTHAQRQHDYDRVEGGQLTTKQPTTDIFSLARHGRSGEVEELLLRGIPIDTVDDHGNTILHVGTQNGHKKIVKLSLRYGADINAVNNQHNTPLHFAMKYGHQNLGQYLISKGADTSISC